MSAAVPQPAFVQERVALFEKLYAVQQAEFAKKAENSQVIQITLPDKSVREAKSFVDTPLDIAGRISKSLQKKTIGCKVNGHPFDCWRPFEESCELELLTFDSEEGKDVFWHSSAHVLGQALELLFGAHLCIGPPIEAGGFYYDGALDGRAISEKDFTDIENKVKEIAAQKQRFERLVVSRDDALSLFSYNKYKVEIISNLPADATVTVYRCGPLIDLCRGPHLPSTELVKAFKATKTSAVYWRSDAKNDALQRVYGISFPDAKQLKEHLHFMEEAAKRDHRKLGREMHLFLFNDVSPGSCFFLPAGAHIYNKLIELMRHEYRKRGFTEVITPNMFNCDLWRTSGHYANYKENMFILDVENQEFGLKPMNCPGHCVLFSSLSHSYRELPIRYADFGVLHRNEASGALTGLTRVRRFQQDDAHIFCRLDQVQDEIYNALNFLNYIYKLVGFEFELNLSTRPEKRMGEESQWDVAEEGLRAALDRFGHPWKLNAGDGAFYGPKIDIQIRDALRRPHQLGTIQLDFQLPIKFNLEFVTDSGRDRPVIVHRAILGSIERMIAILTEHFAAKWPFWLSPRQVIVCPIADRHVEYAQRVRQQIWDAGFMSDIDSSERTVQKKIREAQLMQWNFILVVGDAEVSSNTVNVRTRDNVVHGTESVEDLIANRLKPESLLDILAKLDAASDAGSLAAAASAMSLGAPGVAPPS